MTTAKPSAGECRHETLQFHSGGHFVYCPACRGWWTATTDGQHGTVDFARANSLIIGGETRSAPAPAGVDVREALEEALRGLQYIAPAIPVLRTMLMTKDLKLGAEQAEKMDASNKEAIEKLKVVLAALSAEPKS